MTNIVEKTRERYLEYEKRHREILDAAVRLFNTKGYNGATTAEIARAAGISEPTLYKHFDNKHALFRECFRSIWDDLLARYREVYLAYRENEIEYLKGVSRIYFDFVMNNPDKSMFVVHLLRYKNDPDFQADYKQLMGTSISTVKRVLDSARKKGRIKSTVPTHMLAAVFVCQYVEVIMVKDFTDPDAFTVENQFEMMKMMMGLEPVDPGA